MKILDVYEIAKPNINGIAIIDKLCFTSFGKPSLDLQVYKLKNFVNEYYSFFEQERIKAIDKWGISDNDGNKKISENHLADFSMFVNEILEIEIENNKLFKISLTIENFDNDNCYYNSQKDLWLCGKDIAIILNLIDLINSELSKKN